MLRIKGSEGNVEATNLMKRFATKRRANLLLEAISSSKVSGQFYKSQTYTAILRLTNMLLRCPGMQVHFSNLIL